MSFALNSPTAVPRILCSLHYLWFIRLFELLFPLCPLSVLVFTHCSSCHVLAIMICLTRHRMDDILFTILISSFIHLLFHFFLCFPHSCLSCLLVLSIQALYWNIRMCANLLDHLYLLIYLSLFVSDDDISVSFRPCFAGWQEVSPI